MRKRYIIVIILFLLPLFVIGAFCVFDEDPTISLRENRALKKMPGFSFDELFFGDFTLEFEEYFTDTFPFRDEIMSANTELNRLYYFTPFGPNDEISLLIPQDTDIAEGGESLAVFDTDSLYDINDETGADNYAGADPSPGTENRPDTESSPDPVHTAP